MRLTFPNPSRCYDSASRRIRFWGHDGAVEVPFFMEESAIFFLQPKTKNTEAAILQVFDEARERIFTVALRLYAPDAHRSFYSLKSTDFAFVGSR